MSEEGNHLIEVIDSDGNPKVVEVLVYVSELNYHASVPNERSGGRVDHGRGHTTVDAAIDEALEKAGLCRVVPHPGMFKIEER